MKRLLVIAFLAVMTYILWMRGFLVIKSKMAVAFIGKRGNDYWGAAVTACTGFTKRVIPLEKGKQYRFLYDENISGGNISVELACGKNVVRKFDKINVTTLLNAGDGVYTVTTRFKKASGGYTLKWEEV